MSTTPWRRGRPADRPAGRPSNRLWVIVAAAFTLFALLGALVGFVLYLQPYPPPRFVPLVLDEYGPTIPLRLWARQDADAFKELKWQTQQDSHNKQTAAQLRDELTHIEGLKGDLPLVVFLSGYVVADEKGKPCIFPVESNLDDRTTWVPLDAVLAAVCGCKAPKKLLLIDVMQPLVLPEQGLLRRDAADLVMPALEDAVKQDPTLAILTACSEGQVSLTSEELGQSLFGYFVLQGLRGQADGGAGDLVVTVQELADFVTKEVEAWAWRNLRAYQTPRRLGTATFELQSPRGDHEPSPVPAAYPKWLAAEWKRLDGWWTDGAHRRQPELYLKLGRALLRADRRWRGGYGDARVEADLASQVAGLQREYVAGTAPGEAKSVAEAVKRSPASARPPEDDAVAQLRLLADLADRLADEKASEARKKEFDQSLEAFVGKFKKDRPLPLAAVCLDALSQGEPPVRREGLQLVAGVLEKTGLTGYEEVYFVRKLAKEAKARPAAFSAAASQLAVQASREAAQAATIPDEVLPWVRAELRRGSELTRKGEKCLLLEQNWEGAAKAAFQEGYQAYRTVNREATDIAEAQQACDEALVLLPGYLPALDLQPDQADDWARAAQTTRDLRQALAVPTDVMGGQRALAVQRIQQLASALQTDPKGLAGLWRPVSLAEFAAQVEPRASPEPGDVRQPAGLLASAWPSEWQRQRLWAAYRERAAGLLASSRTPPPRPGWSAKAGRERLLRQDLGRGRRYLRWLEMARDETDDIRDLRTKLDRLADLPADQAPWQEAGAALKRALAGANLSERP